MVASRHNNNIVGPEPHPFADGRKRTVSQYAEDEIRYRSIVMETFESARNSTQKMDIAKLRVAALKTLVLEAKIKGVRFISNTLCRRITMTMFAVKAIHIYTVIPNIWGSEFVPPKVTVAKSAKLLHFPEVLSSKLGANTC